MSQSSSRVTLAQGEGGLAARQLLESVFLSAFDCPELRQLEDQARASLAELSLLGDRLAFTTDSYVVDPIEFPGGDIGTLAVNGTLNDLAVGGAIPRFLSCGFILEEGLELELLRRITRSMAQAARAAGVAIVTGDTKVVPRGKADKVFINTSGIGIIPAGIQMAARQCEPGDVIIVSGTLGDHGAAIMQARGDLGLQVDIASDCQPLHELVQLMLTASRDIHAMRDATRGGLATVLSEMAGTAGVGFQLDEDALPIRAEVRGVCEILGLDPAYLANEGMLAAVLPESEADAVLAAMRRHPAGQDACLIGRVVDQWPGKVQVKSRFGGRRLLEPLTGAQLPRIC
ncbi:hydrogenase expression/formation protein HypE [Marinobacterium sp. AK62]|uniref:Hydrogenase expression/formation protein HypE n=1 Tax=Marinobacterium alkalitolerans TaxID=1542925 RepID=A0ABS3ZDV2_9GAMM|nr:hydrogenase expression/formation protein HypE [Marinobacterium alkalitolerans]MBP0049881.1 hydrogenase expression/formation protein HypE [Marinobacterium alkalitolerans]